MISYSAANFLLGRVSTAAPYWGAFGVDLVALAIAARFETARKGRGSETADRWQLRRQNRSIIIDGPPNQFPSILDWGGLDRDSRRSCCRSV